MDSNGNSLQHFAKLACKMNQKSHLNTWEDQQEEEAASGEEVFHLEQPKPFSAPNLYEPPSDSA